MCGIASTKQGFEGEIWRNVRFEISRLLKISVTDENRHIPDNLIGSVQILLLQLVDDLDPTLEADRPPNGWFGHNDPATVAINHVRPVSLAALIFCAFAIAKQKMLYGWH